MEIVAYLKYLRGVLKRVLLRTGLKDIFKKRGQQKVSYFNYQLHESLLPRYLELVSRLLGDGGENHLYMGLGLIIGKKKSGPRGEGQKLGAPFVYVPVYLNEEEEGVKAEISWAEAEVNYDVLDVLMGIEEQMNEETLREAGIGLINPVLENMHQRVEGLTERVDQLVNSAGKERLMRDGRELEGLFMEYVAPMIGGLYRARGQREDFDWSPDNYHARENLERLRAQEGVKYYPQTFFFTAKRPSELTTYDDLGKIIELHEGRRARLNHPVLNRMMQCVDPGYAETGEKEIRRKVEEEASAREVEKAIARLPIPLSEEQREAIRMAWRQNVSYIQGPPGTGKSHTITGIMLCGLWLNRKVLLVSSKSDAVRVVREMLERYLKPTRIVYAAYEAKDRSEMYDYLTGVADRIGRWADRGDRRAWIERRRGELEEYINQMETLQRKIRREENLIMNFLERERRFYETNKDFVTERDRLCEEGVIDREWRLASGIATLTEASLEQMVELLRKLYGRVKDGRIKPIDQRLILSLIRRYVRQYKLCPRRAWEAYRKQSVMYFEQIFKLLAQFQLVQQQMSARDIAEIEECRRRKSLHEEKLKEIQGRAITALAEVSSVTAGLNVKFQLGEFAALWRWRDPKRVLEVRDRLDYQRLLEVFPLWVAELRHTGHYLPFQTEMFDLVVVDEASQVNIAEVIPAIYRGRAVCIVGDDKQLGLSSAGLFVVNRNIERMLWDRHCGGDNFDEAQRRRIVLSRDSILDFVKENPEMRVRSVMLREHFRSVPRLASFNNISFYDGRLRIMKEIPGLVDLPCFKAIRTGGRRGSQKQNGEEKEARVVMEEVKKVMEILRDLMVDRKWLDGNEKYQDLRSHRFTEPPSIGVLAFTTDQAECIEEIVAESFDSNLLKLHRLKVGTPERFQGSERDIMLITLAHDGVARYAAGHYEDVRRFNVATSRAIWYTFFIYGGLSVGARLVKRYLAHFGELTKEDSENVDSVQKVSYGWGFSLNRCQSEFERRVAQFLVDYCSGRPKVRLYNQASIGIDIESCGQKRLDFVLYNEVTGRYVAVEVDGKYHYDDGMGRLYGEAHIKRIEILKRAGWQVVNLPYYQWYDRGWLCDLQNDRFRLYWEEVCQRLDILLGFTVNGS
ncbi:MAG: AAA domain-containing protein [Methylacidiphilales bacterium]|nr:AAA domain-containing protein [Candidatus Methylacidiphilales bacterium]MDW8350223.1 AAA domain-containing protein [Verrucomicrobiae bacterium]